jgi:SPOR domain
MADRYQDRNFMADDMDRGSASRGPARSESDPLAELARLIGQNDPFAGAGRAGPKVQVPPKVAPEPVVRAPEPLSNDPLASAGPPPWMQQRGGSRPEAPRQPQQPPAPDQNFQEPVHPLHRYGAAQPAPQQQAFEDPAFPEEDEQNEPSRYDDALFGQLDRGGQDLQRHQDYADDPYAFEEEDGYDEGEEEEDQKRGGGFAKVLMVLTLAVVGTGGAFAYRAYVGSPQNVDPPIIRADNSPTKIVPSPSDGSPKVPDRLGMGERTEKLVSREEAPVDINSRSGGPRVVFPQLSQGGNPPPVPPMNVATNDPPPPPPSAPVAAPPSSGTTANGEPRRIKTLSVRSDQAEPAAAPAAAPPMTRSITAKPGRNPPASANASANTPMSLSPQAAAPAAAESRMASTNAAQGADTGVTPTNGYLVQVSSQRSEADAQTSYRSLQTKFPDMLGQRPPVIKRADLGEKGIYYRAMVGPFGTPDEAVQMCNSLKTAGGQCVVQKK